MASISGLFFSVQITLLVMFMGMVTGHREKSVDLAQVDHVTPLPRYPSGGRKGRRQFWPPLTSKFDKIVV